MYSDYTLGLRAVGLRTIKATKSQVFWKECESNPGVHAVTAARQIGLY
jgi:hypothetical protein